MWSDLASFLDEQCKQRNLSWREASLQAGLDHGAISRFIRGTQPNTATSHKLAKFFGVDPDIVLQLAGHKKDTSISPGSRTEAMTLIEDLLLSLPEDVQWKLYEMIKLEHKFVSQHPAQNDDPDLAQAS
jgi:transcriptional regulator with XRE-family HTH domain